MIIEHRGKSPCIDATATIDMQALISGDVTIGAYTVVLAGAIITAESAAVTIGEKAVIMEHALIRGAGIHPCTIEDHVLIGPHVSISGATIQSCCFIATGSVILNGALLEKGTTVAVGGIVQIETHCPPATFIPMQHIAFGNPAIIYTPNQAMLVHQEMFKLGFTRIVFGFDSSSMEDADATRELCEKYTHALSKQRNSL